MKRLHNGYESIHDVVRNQRGQTLVEYGMILILVAVLLIAMITILGRTTCNMYSDIANEIPATSSP